MGHAPLGGPAPCFIQFTFYFILGGNQQDGGVTTEILLVNDISNLGNWFTGI